MIQAPFQHRLLVNLFINTLIIALIFAGVATTSAQDSMERIVAVVGSEIILKTDVDGQAEAYAQRFPSINKSDPKLRESILDQLINERLIMMAAQEDTNIIVTEDEITQRMDYQIQMLVQQVGSEKRIEDIYGMSMSKIKREFRDEIRKALLIEKMRQKKFSNVKAMKSDVDEFFKEFKDSIPAVPTRIDLYHIVIHVRPSDEQKREAHNLAIHIRDSIVKGGSFADFARRYSGDPGSAVNGGDLGFVEKGKFVPAFETAAFGLDPGQMSEPVETPFGWHIIQLIEKTSTTINCRHILIKVTQNESDRAQVVNELNNIKKRVTDGEDFETLARELTDEKETQGFGGSMGQLELERMPEDMRTAVAALKDGEISEPLPYVTDPTKPGLHILYRKATIDSHKPTLESDFKMLEQMATYRKKQVMEQEWVTELRGRLYWEKR